MPPRPATVERCAVFKLARQKILSANLHLPMGASPNRSRPPGTLQSMTPNSGDSPYEGPLPPKSDDLRGHEELPAAIATTSRRGANRRDSRMQRELAYRRTPQVGESRASDKRSAFAFGLVNEPTLKRVNIEGFLNDLRILRSGEARLTITVSREFAFIAFAELGESWGLRLNFEIEAIEQW